MKIKISVLLAIFTIGSLLLGSYALITKTVVSSKNYLISVGDLDIHIENENSEITLVDGYPTTDTSGMNSTPYTFQLNNRGKQKLSYEVKLLPNETSTLAIDKVKYFIEEGTNSSGPDLLSTQSVIYSGIIKPKEVLNFKLRLWLDINATIEEQGKEFTGKVLVTATQVINEFYVDNNGANSPEILSGMIPVVYDGENWIKADQKSKWYDYDQQWWANVVTVSESSRENYMNAENGTTINMDDINTMWVWVPRYEYEPITSTTATEIKVNFLNETESNVTDNYITHPAFTFGDEELTGIWVAKFEASSDQSCNAVTGNIDTGCDLTTLKVNIKPNVPSWRGIRTSTIDLNARAMNTNGNIYGFLESEVDTHAIKNMEWGAVSYLSQSKYGKYGNSNYEGANKEIYQNKSSGFITGMSNGTPSQSTTNTQVAYNVEEIGTGASTTGNIYGIYDMSGGSWEYVMGVMKDNSNSAPMSGNSIADNSGFSGKVYDSGNYTNFIGRDWSNNKYYDLYDFGTTYNDDAAYARAKIGDATIETRGWYGDTDYFIESVYSWLIRGGNYGGDTTSGIFYFSRTRGFANASGSFRPVLVKK